MYEVLISKIQFAKISNIIFAHLDSLKIPICLPRNLNFLDRYSYGDGARKFEYWLLQSAEVLFFKVL